MKRIDIFHVLREKWSASRKDQTHHLWNHFERTCHFSGYTLEDLEMSRKRTSALISKIFVRWQKSNRKYDAFWSKNKEWLNEEAFIFPPRPAPAEVTEETASSNKPDVPGPGRPRSHFRELSERSKRRRANEALVNTSVEELTYSTKVGLRSQGKREAAQLFGEAITTPTRATKMKKAWNLSKNSEQTAVPLSTDEALSLIVGANLSRSQYQLIRDTMKHHNADILPSYKEIQEAKKQCYPRPEEIKISERGGEVRLQGLVDLTVTRLMRTVNDSLTDLSDSNINLIWKWGLDGASSQSMHKQAVPFPEFSDHSLVMVSLVPLQLFTNTPEEKKKILWQNSRPSSKRLCRPLKFEFSKESPELTVSLKDWVQNQIAVLDSSKYSANIHNAQTFLVKHQFHLTMLDGKVCNALTDTKSTQTCNVCGAKPSDLANLRRSQSKQINHNALQYGISPLHSLIRSFECLLHISYRLEVKKWRIYSEVDKDRVAQRKFRIQTDFRERTGLIIDQPKQGGGSSNDGNTARRFFHNTACTAEITGIDIALIEKLSTILQALASPLEINASKFKAYAMDVALLYYNLYSWYPMPPSLHKVLIHGADLISALPLPIGQFSEEAQEARNKDSRRFRERHTRKSSRLACNEDLMHILLITSDPLLNELGRSSPKKLSFIPPDVLNLLNPPDSDHSILCNEEIEDSDSEEEILL